MRKTKTAILIYDDRCSLCRGCMKWIELHAIQEDAFEFVPCQSEERKNRFPEITDKACQKSFHIVLPNNKILAGDKALPEGLNRLKGFRWLSILFLMPIIKSFLYVIYCRVSGNRFIISQTIKPLVEE